MSLSARLSVHLLSHWLVRQKCAKVGFLSLYLHLALISCRQGSGTHGDSSALIRYIRRPDDGPLSHHGPPGSEESLLCAVPHRHTQCSWKDWRALSFTAALHKQALKGKKNKRSSVHSPLWFVRRHHKSRQLNWFLRSSLKGPEPDSECMWQHWCLRQ